jgi:hypothetical protein
MLTAVVNGQEVKVGDYVCFKADVEQTGRIIQIDQPRQGWGRTPILLLRNDNMFVGEYIGGEHEARVAAEDCWIED